MRSFRVNHSSNSSAFTSRSSSSSSSSSSRSLKIKPFSRPPAPPPDLYDRTVRILWSATDRMLPPRPRPPSPTSVVSSSSRTIGWSREELYRSVEDLCVHGYAPKLFADVSANLARGAGHCLSQLWSVWRQVESSSTMCLAAVRDVYGAYLEYLTFVRSIFLYLDRTYVNTLPAARSLWEVGIETFCRTARASATKEEDTSVLSTVLTATLATIRRERDGKAVDRGLLKNTLRMLADLPDVFEDVFLPRFLAETRAYFRAEGDRWIEQQRCSLADFMAHVVGRWNQAHDMSVYYLDGRTSLPVLVERHLLEPHVTTFLLKDTHLYPLLDDDDKLLPDVHRLYVFLRRMDKLPLLRAAFGDYAKRHGQSILQDENRAKVIPNLLQWKQRLENIHRTAFLQDDSFATRHDDASSSLRAVLEDVLNGGTDQTSRQLAELLSKHVDNRLRCTKTITDLEPILQLFRHLQAKDVFEAFYKKDLAKRLLLNKSASLDLEKAFITMLKTECGSTYTNKMEGMFKDMDLSRDVMRDYAEQNQPTNLEVQVLTTGYWPNHPQCSNLKLPPPLARSLGTFETYYKHKHQGRRIAWQHTLGQCTMKANFPHGTKDLLLTQYQAMMLLWAYPNNDWDAHDGWTSLEIMDQMGMDPNQDRDECERVLQSLTTGKDGTRVLCKRGPGGSKAKKTRTVLPTDKFYFNQDFRSRHHRIRINSIQRLETSTERGETHENVSRDRLYLIDAAIVRIMKARKTVAHHTLLSEVMNQLKFCPTGPDVKKRIASLMEREYLERSAENRDTYHYLA